MRWTATERTRLDRRGFLAALGGATAGALALDPRTAYAVELLIGADPEEPLFASARRNADGRHAVAVMTADGRDLIEVPLPGRGHGIAVSPDRRRLMAFARRPGTFAVLFDRDGRSAPQVIASPAGRHFYGHGAFSPDGRLVLAVENDFEAARGVVGLYDVSGPAVRRLGEIDTFGVGPHDLLFADGGRTLVVANGGIETHPDHGRDKLNLDTMRPSVVFLDAASGTLLAEHRLSDDLHQLSLRHMGLDARGRVWVGGQFEGDPGLTPPLVARLARDEAPLVLGAPAAVARSLHNYVGSVAVNVAGDVVATSCPRGGRVLYWDAASGALLGAQDIADGCGLAPIDETGFLVSDGFGALSYVPDPTARPEVLGRPAGVAWDNHMAAL
ncbi:DUF1513 domain-containing protein [Polymorphum gilvum]|uniref:Twin-arginine translocation pathway signal n=1 Tax=Polymorphum gilvum (strain LMG 25793 / CGMCC 1.9160 / SL003B-26A1) TaxID=991905 RepID=F2J2X4_POLGS|nr:DUF1513 domain-containing protein [Polymorphum gilvum]ADZ68844.1 Twin-arginine translocation pathway signal [Polymorphum gilvum SL003B-26A1]